MTMLRVRVESIVQAATTVKVFELKPVDGDSLPAFGAGAHIDLHLPGEIRRSYSLMNDPRERQRYVIGVNLEAQGRGGSRYLHADVRAGDELVIDGPRNHFELADTAGEAILVAGGIGITPLWSMIQQLDASNRPWHLLYASRSPEHAILLGELARYPGRVTLHHDSRAEGRKPDIGGFVGSRPDDAHFYCCGPAPMLDAFEQATSGFAPGRVHLERFAARKGETAVSSPCTVVLARSGTTLEVPADKSILEVLLHNGVDIAWSCTQGICGSCETTVLEGIPDHRDDCLSRSERAANRKIMVCCSRSLNGRLVLDL